MAVRKGLRGGVVELTNLIAVADSEKDVSYFDINSLYPFICLKNKFVVGPASICWELKWFHISAWTVREVAFSTMTQCSTL